MNALNDNVRQAVIMWLKLTWKEAVTIRNHYPRLWASPTG